MMMVRKKEVIHCMGRNAVADLWLVVNGGLIDFGFATKCKQFNSRYSEV